MYDAFLLLSFGGPEGPDDVIPFLENVLRGKNVPRERMLEVAEHYHHFGGVSPINAQNRELLTKLVPEFQKRGIDLPIFWGNRNWHPLLTDTMRQMADQGIRRVIAFFTSAYSSYSGCRQYRENIAQAQQGVGENAPQVDKLRVFFNHPGFIQPMVDRLQAALAQVPVERRSQAELLFTAHSIPIAMSAGCRYVAQLEEAIRLICEGVNRPAGRLVYQSRSGPPSQPWLEPDVRDVLREIAQAGTARDVIVTPVGFISDHLEVLFDLDTEAQELSKELGLNMIRVPTVGSDPRFVSMIADLVEERLGRTSGRQALGTMGPSHDVCPVDCCLSGRPSGPPTGARPG